MTEPQQPDASGLLDLVRQYGDACGATVATMEMEGPSEVEAARGAERRLFARIEAEVQRLRDEHGAALAEVARLTASIASQIAAKESWIAATESIKDVVTRPLCLLLSVHRNEDIVPAIERLKLAVKLGQTARTELEGRLANGQGPWPAEPGPLRLTLPEVPPGAILIGARTQRHWIWSEAFQLWVTENDKRNLGDLLSFEGEVEVRLAPPGATS